MRHDGLPPIAASLPVADALPALRDALAKGNAAVVVAPPGAGKTTLVPLALLHEPWCSGRVLVLEPRRIAARAAAARMAELTGTRVGGLVGQRMRGDTRAGRDTRIEVVTEGVLTRLLQHDASLDGVAAVVFDEFHERSLDADLGLALVREVQLTLRPDLRIVVMSATLAAEPVAALLGGAPVIISEGRAFPVATIHAPAEPGEPWDRAVARVVRRALADQSGDVLVFLPGVGEIGRVRRLLDGVPAEVLSLHGSLRLAEQSRVLAPGERRRVVLATSVAQTSVTVEGVTVVVDGGLARVPRYDSRRGMGHLTTVRVSRDAADQRRGRAGRLQPGTCYRLWSENDDARLVPAATPEILEADLGPLALELACWGSADGRGLAWLDPPPVFALDSARRLLATLDALDHDGRVSAHGRALAELGIHPRLAHLVLRGTERGAGPLACLLAAVLAERDPLTSTARHERPADLVVRLQLFRAGQGRAHRDSSDRETIERIGRDRRRLASLIGAGAGAGDEAYDPADEHLVAPLVALAHPERLAKLRPGSRHRYVLAGGSGAALAEHDPLAGSPWLAVAEIDRQGPRPGADGRNVGPVAADGVIRLAAALHPDELEDVLRDRDELVDVVGWIRGDVVARRERRAGQIVVSEHPLPAERNGAIADALLDGIAQEGLGLLDWTLAATRLRDRIGFLHDVFGPPWPATHDEALQARSSEWLRPALAGLRRRSDLARVDVAAALRTSIGWSLGSDLDRLAPERIRVPSGREIVVDYGHRPPVLAVKLQELFGATSTPTVAGGRVPVVLHLLSPAGRPVQVTQDLAAFWAGSYRAVRAELRGRYPRHPWPEDPLAAPPTARVKPRGT